MPTFTVHQPPPKRGETVSAPERVVFVRDGFYFWAFLLTPFWLLLHRLWLAFVVYVIVATLLGIGLTAIGAPAEVRGLAALVISLLVGFEAAAIWRRKLAWRRWKTLGFVVGEDLESAEQRFFAEWSARGRAAPAQPMPPPAAAAPEPAYAAPARQAPPPPSDVIGLFPEPGGGR